MTRATDPTYALVAWLRKQMAADETRLRHSMFSDRMNGVALVPDADAKLAKLEADRLLLDTAGAAVIRGIGARYADRDGYEEEWRP